MGIKKLLAYTFLALAPFVIYSGVARSQKVNMPSYNRTPYTAKKYDYTHQEKLNLPQFPFTEEEMEEAIKSYITYLSLIMGSKAKMSAVDSPYSITDPKIKSEFKRKIDEFADPVQIT